MFVFLLLSIKRAILELSGFQQLDVIGGCSIVKRRTTLPYHLIYSVIVALQVVISLDKLQKNAAERAVGDSPWRSANLDIITPEGPDLDEVSFLLIMEARIILHNG